MKEPKICLVKYLYWETMDYSYPKSKHKHLSCMDCLFKDRCSYLVAENTEEKSYDKDGNDQT